VFKSEIYPYLFVTAALLAVLGLELVIRGAIYRDHKEVICGSCKIRVVGRKVRRGLVRGPGVRCPQGNHLAEQSPAQVGLLVLLIIIAALIIWGEAPGTG
jgi:hypothetical protein